MLHCTAFSFYIYVARLCLWLPLFTMTSRCEVLIKESVVDPFSLIMERQNALMEKIIEIDEKLNSLQNSERNVPEDEPACITAKSIENIMNNKLLNMTNQAISLIESKFSSLMLESHSKFEKLDDCYAYVDTIKKDVESIVLKKYENFNSNPPLSPESEDTFESDSLLSYDSNNLYENSSDYNDTQGQTRPQLLQNDTFNFKRNIEKIINEEFKMTNETLHRMEIILRRIEYRQQVNNIARDRTLDIILRRMVLNRNAIEDKVLRSFDQGIHLLKDDLRRQEDALKDLTTKENYLMGTLVDIATEMEVSNSEQKLEKTARERGSATNIGVDKEEELQDKGFIAGNKTENAGGSNLTEVEDGDFEVSEQPLTTDAATTKRSAFSVLNSIKHFLGVENKIPDDRIEENNTNSRSIAADEKLYELEESTLKAVKEVDEKVSGLHIYQSSALHAHLKEILHEIAKMEMRISEIVQKVGNKISTKIDITRKAMFTFVDAAVTSISSAAVTSSQSTGIQIAKTLRNVLKLAFKEFQVSVWNDLTSCPGMFQKVGSKCLLILDSITIPWKQSCQLCSSIGGEIAALTSQDQKILKRLPTTLTPGLWIRIPGDEEGGCGEVDKEEKEIENAIEISAQDTTGARGESKDCRALLDDGVTVGLAPCNLGFGVVCQYGGRIQGGSSVFGNLTLSHMEAELDSLIKKVKYFKL